MSTARRATRRRRLDGALSGERLHEFVVELQPRPARDALEVSHLIERPGRGPGHKVCAGLESAKPLPHHHAGPLHHILEVVPVPVGHQRHHITQQKHVCRVEQPHKFLLPARVQAVRRRLAGRVHGSHLEYVERPRRFTEENRAAAYMDDFHGERRGWWNCCVPTWSNLFAAGSMASRRVRSLSSANAPPGFNLASRVTLGGVIQTTDTGAVAISLDSVVCPRHVPTKDT